MLPVAQQKLSFFDLLVSEVNHRTFVGLLAVLVLLLHLLLMIWLLQPDDNEKPTKPLKIIEVALLSEPNPVVNTPPAPPPKPVPVKTVTPKKKPVKPVIKKKEPVVQKQPEILTAKPESNSPILIPSPATNEVKQNTETAPPVAKPQPAVGKPSEKPGSGENSAPSSGVVPLTRVQPKYPMRAANRHIEGWVKIEFTVTENGTVTNAVVVAAEPNGIFDDAALDAIAKWTFKQKIVNGKSVKQRAVQVLKFKLIN